jgi:hypothetical protein
VENSVDVEKYDDLHVSYEMDGYAAQSLFGNDAAYNTLLDERLEPPHVVCNA